MESDTQRKMNKKGVPPMDPAALQRRNTRRESIVLSNASSPKRVESESSSASDEGIPYGSKRSGRLGTRMGSSNAPFGTRGSYRERTAEPFEPPEKGYRPMDPSPDERSDASSSAASQLSTPSGDDGFGMLEEKDEEEGRKDVITDKLRITIFSLMVVTQLVANFDSGALASIYGMKPQGNRVVCTPDAPNAESWECPPPESDGSTYPPTQTHPDVTTFMLFNTTSYDLMCNQLTDSANCTGNVTWGCARSLGSYVDAVINGSYTCAFTEMEDLKQSLLHDPNFDELYMNKNLQGFLSSIVYLGLSLGAVLTGIGFRYMKPQKLVQLSLLLNAVFAALFAVSINRAMLFMTRFLVGITQATLLVYAPVWVDEFAIPQYASLWMSLIQAAVPLGIVGGYICAGTLASSSSLEWGWSFYIQCVALAPLVVLQFFIPPYMMNVPTGPTEEDNKENKESSSDEEKEEQSALNEVLSNPVVWCAVLAITSLYFVVTSMQLWITDYLTTEPLPVSIPGETREDRYSTIVLAFGVTAITGPIAGVLLGGYILDSPRWVGGYAEHPNKAAFFSAVAGVGAATAAILSLMMTSFWPFIIVIWFTLFFGGMVLPGMTGIVVGSVAIEHRGITSSFAGLMFNLFGYFAGPFVTGIVASNHGLKRGFQVALSWSVVAALLGIMTWVVGLRKKFANGVTNRDTIYCKSVAKAVCGYKLIEADNEEFPVHAIDEQQGVATLVSLDKKLDPLVKLLLLLAEYAEDDPLDVVSLRRMSSELRTPPTPNLGIIPTASSSRLFDCAPELEPLYEFFNVLDLQKNGSLTCEILETVLRDKKSLRRKLRQLEGVEGDTVVTIASEFRAMLGVTHPSEPLTWTDFLRNQEELMRFIRDWRFKPLPVEYILTGFANGTNKHLKLMRGERDGLPYWWGPASDHTDADPNHSCDTIDTGSTSTTVAGRRARQGNEDRRNAQIYLFSMIRNGRRGWMIGTPEDFVLRYHGYFIAAATNKFDLLSSPHKQQTWTFANRAAEKNNWGTTLRVVTREAWATEMTWKEKEARRPALGATASVMGISTFFNKSALLAARRSFIVPTPLHDREKITPAQLLKKLRAHFVDSEATKKHDEADVAGLYETRRMSRTLPATPLANQITLQGPPSTPATTFSPRSFRRRSLAKSPNAPSMGQMSHGNLRPQVSFHLMPTIEEDHLPTVRVGE